MEDFEGWERAEDVLGYVEAAGCPSNRHRLVRWHKEGVLPRPRTRHREGARGLETLYPPGTSAQFLAALKIHKDEKLLDRVAWRLWWDGFPVSMDVVRPFLTERAKWWDEEVAKLIQNGDLSDLAKEFLDESAEAHLDNPVLGQIRRRIGQEDFPGFLEAMLRALLLGDEMNTASTQLVEHGLAFDEGRKPSPVTGEPWRIESVNEDFKALHRMLISRRLPDVITQANDDELLHARESAKTILGGLTTLGSVMQSVFGRWAGGFPFFGRALGQITDDAQGQAWFVIYMYLFETDEEFSANTGVVRKTAEDWRQKGFRAWKALSELAQAVPVAGDLLTMKRWRRAFKDLQAREEFWKEVRDLRKDEDTAKAIDAFFDARPELRSERGKDQ